MVSRGARTKVPISATGISSKGFTLLELVVVLVILATVTALVFPRISALQDGDTRATARNMASMMRYLDERSASGRNRYLLLFDLDEQRVTVFQIDASGKEIMPDDPYMQRNPLIGKVRILDLVTDRLGTIKNGVVKIRYGVAGLAEPVLLHLEGSNGKQYTVQALPVSGSVKIAEGNLEIIK